MTALENVTAIRKALARATLEHSAPNTFDAKELHVNYAAPSPQAQATLGDFVDFSSEDGLQGFRATRVRATGRRPSGWSVVLIATVDPGLVTTVRMTKACTYCMGEPLSVPQENPDGCPACGGSGKSTPLRRKAT